MSISHTRMIPMDEDHIPYICSITGRLLSPKCLQFVSKLTSFVSNLDNVDKVVYRVYKEEMVNFDYSYNPYLYQVILRLLKPTLRGYTRLSAKTFFECFIKHPDSVVDLFEPNRDQEMDPRQTFYDWCHYSKFFERLEGGTVFKDERELISYFSFVPFLRDICKGYCRAMSLGGDKSLELLAMIDDISSV